MASILVTSMAEVEMYPASLDVFDFDNVLLPHHCSAGTERTPLDLFSNYEIKGSGLTDRRQRDARKDHIRILRTTERFTSLDFPLHEYTRSELIEICIMIFHKFDLLRELLIEEAVLRKLLTELALRYQHAPYHHWTHAVYLLYLA